jgi:hypothetical protein
MVRESAFDPDVDLHGHHPDIALTAVGEDGVLEVVDVAVGVVHDRHDHVDLTGFQHLEEPGWPGMAGQADEPEFAPFLLLEQAGEDTVVRQHLSDLLPPM